MHSLIFAVVKHTYMLIKKIKRLAILSAFSIMIATGCNNNNDKPVENTPTTNAGNHPASLAYTITKMYPHNPKSFTEGLEWHDSVLYEGTGLEKESRMAIVNLTTGEDIKTLKLSDEYFGEGITVLNGKIYELTYKSGKAFVYDAKTFKKIKEFTYEGEGWGLTNNGKEILMSNGSSKIVYRNPETFAITKTINVSSDTGDVQNVNELELVDGYIYANIWETRFIIKINPENGQVVAVADFTGLLEQYVPDAQHFEVLNGIAYDSVGKRFFITGKWWPKVFEVQFN